MEPSELLRKVAESLDKLAISYFVTGSMATIAYGEPRMTNDIDMIVVLPLAKVAAFCEQFPEPEYHCWPESVREAVRQHRQFNILHPGSGLKVDVIIPAENEFNRSRLSRVRRVFVSKDFSAWFASPEDVILKKLEYFREGGSDKHLRDIAGVLKLLGSRIDQEYLEEWLMKLQLTDQWQKLTAHLANEKPSPG